MICDSEGEVISTSFDKLEKVLEPIHTELTAYLQALQRATVSRVILEADALTVVQAVVYADTDRSFGEWPGVGAEGLTAF